jgi:spermidine/putrescine transport system substrate-binding protein
MGDGAGDAPVWSPPDLDRRAFLRRVVAAGGLAALAPMLDACSRSVPLESTRGPVGALPTASAATGAVDFVNWPYYIDRSDGGHPSLQRFTDTTGTAVNYSRGIRDEATFFDRVRPALRSGRNPGFDLAVLSNGPELFELISKGWLHPLDHSLIPNFARFASDQVRDPVWDLGNQYTIAWQSGITGIAFRPEAVDALGRRPTSVHDLWEPALKGRVGMLRDLNDLGSFGLLAIDVSPATSTPDDWLRAAERLKAQRDLVRGYFDQGYIGALRRGNVWATMAWSGDVFQLQLSSPGAFEFVVPEEGGMFWTDNLFIPFTAEHPADAMLLMNFVYRPHIAALIADAVRYTSPVPAARRIVAKDLHDPVVADSQFVFPRWDAVPDSGTDPSVGADDVAALAPTRLVDYYPFIGVDQARAWQQTFGPVVG